MTYSLNGSSIEHADAGMMITDNIYFCNHYFHCYTASLWLCLVGWGGRNFKQAFGSNWGCKSVTLVFVFCYSSSNTFPDGFQTGQHKECVRPSTMSWRQMAKWIHTCCHAQPTAAVGNIPFTPRCQWIGQDRQCTYERNIEARSCNHFCSGKEISITFWQCVCTLSYPAWKGNEPYCHLWPATF